MMQFARQCRNRINSSDWRGIPSGTVIFARGSSTPNRKARLVFEVRDEGYSLNVGDVSYPVYGAVNFKYALRALHRRGYRNVAIVIKLRKSEVEQWWLRNGIKAAS